MNNNILKIIYKCIAWSILILSLILISAYAIAQHNNYLYTNVLFTESIICIMIGIFASISGNPLSLSFQTIEQNNSQFKALELLHSTDTEEAKTKTLGTMFILSNVFVFASSVSVECNSSKALNWELFCSIV